MKPNKIPLLVAGLLIVGMVWAMGEIYKDQATSSVQITNEGTFLSLETVEIHYIQSYLGEFSKKVLLKVQSTHKSSTNVDGQQSTTVIEARSEKDFFAKPLWTLTDNGNEVAYLNEEFIASETFGCCGDFDRSKIYHVETGNSPATFIDDDFFTISVPNSGLGNRYFAQIDDKPTPTDKGDQKYIGSLGYFDVTGKMSIVRFYAKVSPGWSTALSDIFLLNLAGKNSKNVLRDKDLELWDNEGETLAEQAFKGFGITGKIIFASKTLVFTVPIKGDKIDAAGVKVSSGLNFDLIQ